MADETSTPRPEIEAHLKAQHAPPNLRVLLVDDHDDLLLMMNLMFKRKRGYTVETAQSGHQAMQKASDFSPHIVISDITMPGMNGIELMENLRKLEDKKLSPFKAIALSGYEADYDTRVLDCGYDAHLTKPVDFEVLVQTIDLMALGMKDQELQKVLHKQSD